MSNDLTMQEAIADGMIALVNAADGMDQQSFADLLESVAASLAADAGKYDAKNPFRSPKPGTKTSRHSPTEHSHEGFWHFPKQASLDGFAPLPSP